MLKGMMTFSMDKVSWRGGALVAPVPSVMVSVGDMENSNIITVAWCGITNTVPPKTYISVRPERHSYKILKETGCFLASRSSTPPQVHFTMTT